MFTGKMDRVGCVSIGQLPPLFLPFQIANIYIEELGDTLWDDSPSQDGATTEKFKNCLCKCSCSAASEQPPPPPPPSITYRQRPQLPHFLCEQWSLPASPLATPCSFTLPVRISKTPPPLPLPEKMSPSMPLANGHWASKLAAPASASPLLAPSISSLLNFVANQQQGSQTSTPLPWHSMPNGVSPLANPLMSSMQNPHWMVMAELMKNTTTTKCEPSNNHEVPVNSPSKLPCLPNSQYPLSYDPTKNFILNHLERQYSAPAQLNSEPEQAPISLDLSSSSSTESCSLSPDTRGFVHQQEFQAKQNHLWPDPYPLAKGTNPLKTPLLYRRQNRQMFSSMYAHSTPTSPVHHHHGSDDQGSPGTLNCRKKSQNLHHAAKYRDRRRQRIDQLYQEKEMLEKTRMHHQSTIDQLASNIEALIKIKTSCPPASSASGKELSCFRCPICMQTFFSIGAIHGHLREVHGTSGSDHRAQVNETSAL